MDHISSTPCDFVVDIEMCKSSSEEAASPDPISADKVGKRFFNNICDDEQLIKAENGLCIIKDDHELSPDPGNVTFENRIKKKKVKDKRNFTSAKKPPRPPRGLSLDAADQKLLKEIAELAMIKRAKIERIKVLNKMKAAKASSTSSSSSTGNVLAFLFTLLFFLLLCFQGMSSGSSAVNSHGSSQPSGSRSNSFIIQQYYSDLSARTTSKSSRSPSLVEQVSGLDPRDGPKRVTT